VPANGGILNGNTPIGFDAKRRTLIAYHKYDALGNTQIYLARWEGGKWRIAQASDWKDYRWEIKGGGTLPSGISMGAPQQEGDQLILPVSRLGKNIQLRLNATDLSRTGETSETPVSPVPLTAGVTSAPGMVLNWASAHKDEDKYTIGWLTQPSNHDLPTATTPNSTTLMLFTTQKSIAVGR
jgi:hypothetical protein